MSGSVRDSGCNSPGRLGQSVDLVRLTRRDILLTQPSQLILGGLVIEPVVDWPRPLMKWRRIPGNPRLCQGCQRRNQRARADNFV